MLPALAPSTSRRVALTIRSTRLLIAAATATVLVLPVGIVARPPSVAPEPSTGLALLSAVDPCERVGRDVTCTYTGDEAGGADAFTEWVVPDGVTRATFTLLGASGEDRGEVQGGDGARVEATIDGLTGGDVYEVRAGAQGTHGGANADERSADDENQSGGGASDVRPSASGLPGRLLVAGGGGGAGRAGQKDCGPDYCTGLGGAGGDGGATSGSDGAPVTNRDLVPASEDPGGALPGLGGGPGGTDSGGAGGASGNEPTLGGEDLGAGVGGGFGVGGQARRAEDFNTGGSGGGGWFGGGAGGLGGITWECAENRTCGYFSSDRTRSFVAGGGGGGGGSSYAAPLSETGPLSYVGDPMLTPGSHDGVGSVVITYTVPAFAVRVEQGPNQDDPTTAQSAFFTVATDEPVVELTEGDLSLLASTVPGPFEVSIVGSGASWSVTVTWTSTQAGFVRLGVPAGRLESTTTGATNLSSTSQDNSVEYSPRVVDETAPTALVERSDGQVNPTDSAGAGFIVTFSEPVVGFTVDDVEPVVTGLTGVEVRSVTDESTGLPRTRWAVPVRWSADSPGGTISLRLPASAVTDDAGNPSEASTGDESVTYVPAQAPPSPEPPTAQAPTVTIDQGVSQADPTADPSASFDVVFDQPVVGFTADDVRVASDLAGLVVSASGSDARYTVTATWTAGQAGVVTVSLDAGAATSASTGLASSASRSTDNTVTYAPTPPPTDGPGPADPDPVDAVAPETAIVAAPANGRVVRSTTSTVRVRSDEEPFTFVCTYDRVPVGCSGGLVESLALGRPGRHTFTAAAVDAAGNSDPTPARRTWFVPVDASRLQANPSRWTTVLNRGAYDDSVARLGPGEFDVLEHSGLEITAVTILAVDGLGGRLVVRVGDDVVRRIELDGADGLREFTVVPREAFTGLVSISVTGRAGIDAVAYRTRT